MSPLRPVVLALLLAGCAPVHPWERGRLVSEVMADPAEPLEASMDAHVLTTREAMLPDLGAGGASCGCD